MLLTFPKGFKTMHTFEMVNVIIANIDTLVPQYSEKHGFEANKYAVRSGALQSMLSIALSQMGPEKADQFFKEWSTWNPHAVKDI